MADGTVRGAFELSAEQPLRTLTTLRDRGREVDQTMEKIGRTMDTLATKTDVTWSAMSRTVDTHADRITGRVDRLEGKLRDLGRVKATPRVELNGFDRVNAQISELEMRLDRLGSRTARPRAALGGGFAGGGGGGGASSATAGGSASLFQAVGGVPTLALAALGLSPGIMGLLGGATSLVGSAGSAALGAGTVGLAGAGMLGAGAGLSALAIRPAVQGLGEITKAQAAYTKAVDEFGRRSTQAASAQRNLNAAIVANPAAAGAGRQLSMLRSEWQSASAPARAQAYRGISGVLYNARRGAPSIARDSTIATSATADAAISYSGFLTQRPQLEAARTLTMAFARELPTAERTLENMTATVSHLAVAAIPFFHEANRWVEHWSAGLAQSSSHTAQVQEKMRGYVNSAKDWARLTGAAYRTIRDIFGASAPQGDSMVVQLTHTLDRWDRWINSNPEKVQGFFRQAERTTVNIAKAVSGLVSDIAQLANFLSPIFNRAMQFISFVSGMGPGGLGLAGALGYGAYGGLRGATGNRLPSAGRLAGSFITGSAGPGVARGGGGAVIGGGAYTSTLERGGGSYSSYMMPRSGFQTAVARSAIGDQLPLFAAGASGYALRGRAIDLATGEPYAAARGEQAFAARFGGIEGARFAPLEVGGSRAFGLSRLAGPAMGALEGAARFAAPVLAITSVLQGLQTRGNAIDKIGGTLNAGLHMASFGVLPSNSIQRLLGNNAAGSSFGSPEAQSGLLHLAGRASAVRTPAQLRGFMRDATTTAHLRFEMSPEDARRFEGQVTRMMRVASTNAGLAASNGWQDAFVRALDRGQKPAKAVDLMLKGFSTSLHQLGPQGQRALARSTAQWASQMMEDNPKLRRPLERLMSGIVDDLNTMQRKTEGAAKATRDQIFYYNGQILTGSQTAWQAISKSMTDPAQVAQEKLLGIFGQIQAEAVNALTQMGFSRADARAVVSQTVHGGAQARGAAAVVGIQRSIGPQNTLTSKHDVAARRGIGRERGGVISGAGLLDTVPTPDGGRAAPGEAWIANRHTMNDLSRATISMYGKTAWQMIRDEHRQHSAPMYATGGLSTSTMAGSLTGLSSAPGSAGWVERQHPELHPGIAQAVEAVLGRFPLSITSTTGGGHVHGSYHYLGEAADISGGSGIMYRASQWIKSSGLARGLTEGIHNPNLAVKYGQIQAPPGVFGGVWAGHTNHIHLAVAGALHALAGGGAGGGGAAGFMPGSVSLRARRSGLGGVPGALADQGGRLYAAGLSHQLNARLGAGSGAFSSAGFSGGGTSGANQTLGRRMMLAAGWPASEWPALRALWQQESGWSANAVNPSSGAAGIPQALGHGHPFALGDAPGQIAWGLNYIRGRYGSPSAAEAHERSAGWYQRGGRASWAGWHAKGTDFVTRGPTLFGAGEGGRRERVTVGPATTPTRGGARIQVIMQNVNLNAGSPADAERVAEDVAARILDALEGGGHDAALMGAG